jgi:DNA-directed RNA polymerase delta subunit
MNFVLKEGLLIQKVVEEIVLLEPESGDYYTLNEMGALMLENVQKGHTLAELVSNIQQQFNASAEEIEQDLHNLLDELQRCGLAQLKDA